MRKKIKEIGAKNPLPIEISKILAFCNTSLAGIEVYF